MWLALLGPLQVRDGDAELTVPAAKQRVLLATLLLHANHVVSFDELAETIWDGEPAPGANTTVRNYVRRLRQVLGPAAGARVVTRDPGYLIEVSEDELDLLRFARLGRDGGSAIRAREWQLASRNLADALALWRGVPLVDIPSARLLRDEVPPLTQARLQALEWRFEAELQLGRHAESVADLEAASARHPLRERFGVLLMLALYRCGRQADALAVYRAVRQTLADELGVEPGPELRQTHERILRADPGLIGDAPADSMTGLANQGNNLFSGESCAQAGRGEPTSAADRTVHHTAKPTIPRQLPARTPHFAGRTTELKELTKLLDQLGAEPGAQFIAAIGGPPGIGKTTLAVHWAHQVADRFPDGQLYINLRGFDPAGPPLEWPDAIRGFLDALAVPASQMPASPEARASLYRSLLAGKRMLVVLDNARDEQQVRPLIPGEPSCRVVVTSRNELAGLVASHGAHCVTLEVLSEDESRDLLIRHVGPGRLASEPAAVSEVIACCARLPLALTITAARAATGVRRSLAELASDLRKSQSRLDALELEDEAMSVRSVFACSLAGLSDPAARLFRLLGVSPGPEVSIAGAASLIGCDRRQARRLLRELTRACLLTEPAPGRFTCHDLLLAYCAELAENHEPPAERQLALARLLDHYLHTASKAAQQLNPARRPLDLAPAAPGAVVGDFAGKAEALAWFERERAVLVDAIVAADQQGLDGYAWRLPWIVSDYFSYRGSWPEWHATSLTAVAASERSGEIDGRAISLRLAGQSATALGDYDEGRRWVEQSLLFYRQLDEPYGLAAGHLDCARICVFQGNFSDAVPHALDGLKYARRTGLPNLLAAALNGVGWCLAQAGEPSQALAYCQESLALYRATENLNGEPTALDSIGYIHHLLGNYLEAIASFTEAVEGFARIGDRWLEADAASHLAESYQAAGNQAAATDWWQRVLAIMEELDHPDVNTVRARLFPNHGLSSSQ
jgi:DNA-binding SARP family transcriptional activator/tetratricopeptide (TPR) repeat protein